MTEPRRLICNVCHRPLADCDQYLVRFDAVRGTTVVHRSLCFPPARTAGAKPAPRAAA
jgi:RNase P subunit RPR2